MLSRGRLTFLIVFCLALFPALFSPVLFPRLRLLFWAPFIAFSYYRFARLPCIWISLLCGLSLDLLSSTDPFGLHMLSYAITTFFLYNRKQLLFKDTIHTLPVLTALFSLTSTIITLVALNILGDNIPISPTWTWILSDLIIMPTLDAIYALLWFTLPLLLLDTIQKTRRQQPPTLINRPQ